MTAPGPALESEFDFAIETAVDDEAATDFVRAQPVEQLPSTEASADSPSSEPERKHGAADGVRKLFGRRGRAAADSLANSFVVLCLLSLIQPVLGLARGVLFCRWLAPEQLGRWDLALGLLTFATPLLLAGIPGSFGRYVGHYRQRGGLGRFVWQSLMVCLGAMLLAAGALALAARPFASFYFGDAAMAGLVRAVALTLITLAGYGFVVELLTALRLFRASSLVQLARTTAFLAFGALLVGGWQPSATSIVAAFALASVASIVLALWWLVAVWREGPHVEPSGPVVIWRRVLPFAMGVWLCNIVTNSFDMVNPYMLAHFSRLPHQEALAEVGNLHSARILPLLLMAFSNTLASMLIPHLTHSWEIGRREDVGRDVRLFVKLYALALAVGTAVVLLMAPFLFGVVFRGKYDGGLHVLPWTLLSASWMGIAFVAQTYLWCREEARLSSFALAIGLVINLTCNALLVPLWGLQGTVTAGAAGMLTVLAAALWFGHRYGLRIDRTICFAVATPALLLIGPWQAILALVVVLALACSTPLFFDADERRRLADTIKSSLRRVPFVPST
ncbi:MAG: lipopolysaccharide biosynthesis protein [Pirellulales bacterium]